jgi:hypothetical protein
MFRIVVNKLSGSARGRGFKPRPDMSVSDGLVENGENLGQVPVVVTPTGRSTSKRRHGSTRVQYQSNPSSRRDRANDGVLCTFINRLAPDWAKWCGSSGQAAWHSVRPSRTNSHPAGSLSSSQPGGPPCWANPLAFDLIGHHHFLTS